MTKELLYYPINSVCLQHPEFQVMSQTNKVYLEETRNDSFGRILDLAAFLDLVVFFFSVFL
jgi:hypothetical protein